MRQDLSIVAFRAVKLSDQVFRGAKGDNPPIHFTDATNAWVGPGC
jgi:hypothetical protein